MSDFEARSLLTDQAACALYTIRSVHSDQSQYPIIVVQTHIHENHLDLEILDNNSVFR